MDTARTRAFWAANKPGETAAPAYAPQAPVWWHVALALALALILQTSFAPFVAFHGAAPPLLMLVVGWYAVRTGSLSGLAFGAIAGAGEDALSGTTGAAWTLATALAGFAAGRLSGTWLADTYLALVPGAAALIVVRYATFALVLHAEGHSIALPIAHVHAVLWQSVLAACGAFALLRAFPNLVGAGAHGR